MLLQKHGDPTPSPSGFGDSRKGKQDREARKNPPPGFQGLILSYPHPKNANSLNLLLSSSSIPCISIKILPLLCIVGLNGTGLNLATPPGNAAGDCALALGFKGDEKIGDLGDSGDEDPLFFKKLPGDGGSSGIVSSPGVCICIFGLALLVSITNADFGFRNPNLEEIVPATDRRRLLIDLDANPSLPGVCGCCGGDCCISCDG